MSAELEKCNKLMAEEGKLREQIANQADNIKELQAERAKLKADRERLVLENNKVLIENESLKKSLIERNSFGTHEYHCHCCKPYLDVCAQRDELKAELEKIKIHNAWCSECREAKREKNELDALKDQLHRFREVFDSCFEGWT